MKKLFLIAFLFFESGLLASESSSNKFKPFQIDNWNKRYSELLLFFQTYGHVHVPHTYPQNPQLARWVKRQRRQNKLLQQERSSTLDDERIALLNNLGFVWDSHEHRWQENLIELQDFCIENGHCNVSSNHTNKKLATWVKCQRRQYKLLMSGKKSSMTQRRIQELEGIGFEWGKSLTESTVNDLSEEDFFHFTQDWEGYFPDLIR